MMNKLNNLKKPSYLPLALLAILFIGWTLLILGKPFGSAQLKVYSGGLGPVDGIFNYTPDQVYFIFDSMGEIGRAAYLRFVLLDFVFIAIYVPFLALGIYTFSTKDDAAGRILIRLWVLPILAGTADMVEGAFLFTLLRQYPFRLDQVASLMNYFSMAKLILFSLSVLALGLMITLWSVNRYQARQAASISQK
jgi:hypothetical protein